MNSKNKILIKNTLLLYGRLFISMIIGLVTSRVVLHSLGIVDYGIYNIVGGVVTLFTFISSPMIATTQRYLTFEIGKKNILGIQNVFSTCIIIHSALALLILIFAETIGLWFFYNKLIIPPDRFSAALIAYHMSIIICVSSLLLEPFYSIVIAYENMNFYAVVSIIESVLKLIISYLIFISFVDKLILYSLLLMLLSILILSLYVIYTRYKYPETRIKKIGLDKKLLPEIGGFAGWNLFGGIAYIVEAQGVNILLNLFFGPVINAARAIAVQVQGVTLSFVNSFQNAINPQLTKSYACGDSNRLVMLINKSSKFSFFLLLIIALPLIVRTEFVIKLWLGSYPNYTIIFIRLTLIYILLNTLATPLIITSQATGKIKYYQLIVGSICMTSFVFDYIWLKLGGKPWNVYLVSIFIAFIAQFARLKVISKLINFNLVFYFKEVIIRVLCTFIIASILSFGVNIFFPCTLIYSVSFIFLCILISALTIFVIGLNSRERLEITNYLSKLLKNHINQK